MNKEINLEEILKETIQSDKLTGVNKLTFEFHKSVLIEAMKEACKQTLNLAAENATTKRKYTTYGPAEYMGEAVDKQSILNTIKQIK